MEIVDAPEFRDLVTFVPNKKLPVYNWYYYKEGFSRDLVVHYLRKWRPESVFDPFCGVGTTLLAAKEFGIESVGIDVNPVALLASRAKTRNYDKDVLKEEADSLLSIPYHKVQYPGHLRRFFPAPVLEDIWLFRDRIMGMDDRDFFMLALISSAYKCSWMYKDGAVLKVVKRPVPPFRKFFKRQLKRMIRESETYRGPEPIVLEMDARRIELDMEFDAVITSPPYINKIEYTKIYRVENEIMGKEDFHPVRSFVSGNPSDYFRDMEMAISGIAQHMKHGGRLALVVAGAVLPDGTSIESDMILSDIMGSHGIEVERILVARRRVATRKRTIKIGESRESIIEAYFP